MTLEVKRPRRVATSVAAGVPISGSSRETARVPTPSEPEARPRGGGNAPRRLWREIRRNEARWLFLLVTIATALALSDRTNRSGLVWSDVALAWRDALYPLLPWTAAAAAWTAGRERRHGLDELLAATGRPAFRRRLAGWAAVSAMGIAAFALVGGWLALLASGRATASHFDAGAIVVGIVAIPAVAALGFAWGAWQPRRATAVAALVGFGFFQTLFGQGDGWASYLTATPAVATAGRTGIAPDLAAPQCVFFLGLIIVGLALLARVSTKGWAIRGMLAAGALVTVLAVAVIANHGDEVRAAAHAGQANTDARCDTCSAMPRERVPLARRG